MAKVTMYTDGGASGNPGPGGYGTLLMYGEHVKEMSEEIGRASCRERV